MGICGDNKGQHMVLDTDGHNCVKAVFAYGAGTEAREYKIHVTQYGRKNDMGGPTGCLQYFTSDTGTFKSFNFQGDAGVSKIGSPHLANQAYSVCIRQNADKCAICYSASKPFVKSTTTNTFGLSVSPNAIDQAGTGAKCKTDFIYIPNGLTAAVNPTKNTMLTNDLLSTSVERFCGRFLGKEAAIASQTVCSKATPFSVGVVFDGTEVFADNNGAQGMASTDNEAKVMTPAEANAAGTYGFSLGFVQLPC